MNGALTAIRMTRLDIVGVVTLGMVMALGAASSATSCWAACRRPPSATGGTWPWQRAVAWSRSPGSTGTSTGWW
ncbi:hypothetical protein JL106_15945 [Nakamurella sp. YIM 132084]|uniref:Uncharacterized protein n=1 Tax=Nakamurella leprariae TaxID=2803911 RepID=A0A939C0H8_9ACTN|nr:hypothetical protein [Nakamurella leprariae]